MRVEMLVFLSVLAVCQGTSIYVSDSLGSDVEGTGTAGRPFKSISAALSALAETGATNITLLPGTYVGADNTNIRVSIDSNTVRIISEKGPLETFLGSDLDFRVFQIGGAALNGTTTVTLPYVPLNGTDDASTSSVQDSSWQSRVPNLILSGVTLFGGRAQKGGAIYVEGGILKMLNCRVARGGHGVVYIKGQDSKVLIANTVFSNNGAGNNMTSSLRSGGAIFLEGGLLHCDSCRFANNTAAEHGGAIYALSGSLRLSNSNFTLNTAREGGGGAIFFANTTGNSYVVMSKLRNNTAVRGGAVFIGGVSNPQFINSTLAMNSAKHMGGAILTADTTQIGIKRTSFVGNTAEKAGGAIAALGDSTILMGFSFIHRNQADLGGAIYVAGKARPQLTQTILAENTANNGGALLAADMARPTMEKCELSHNHASRGGALYSDDSSRPLFKECRIKENFAAMDGGALFAAFDSAPEFDQCHFLDNASNLGDPFHISASAQEQIKFIMCSVFPHPNRVHEDHDGFPEQVHLW